MTLATDADGRPLLFIADLHLQDGDEHRRQRELATRFLRQQARHAAHLFILGDLFEYWVGDDAHDGECADFLWALGALNQPDLPASARTQVTLMHGNRDFLLGETFASTHHCRLVTADTLLLPEHDLLLMHGDTLCTDDVEYQRVRSKIREPQWQQQFLSQPVAERHQTARQMRAASRERNQSSPIPISAQSAPPTATDITDINQLAVDSALADADVTRLLHGHTHRPAQHAWGHAAAARERTVLGDWHTSHAVIGRLDSTGLHLEVWAG